MMQAACYYLIFLKTCNSEVVYFMKPLVNSKSNVWGMKGR
jgi:hypothetical protein